MNRKEIPTGIWAIIIVLLLSAVNGCMTQQDIAVEKLNEYGETQ